MMESMSNIDFTFDETIAIWLMDAYTEILLRTGADWNHTSDLFAENYA